MFLQTLFPEGQEDEGEGSGSVNEEAAELTQHTLSQPVLCDKGSAMKLFGSCFER